MPVENISSFAHYSDYLKKHKNVLVLYYWKECGYCRMLAPIWDKVVDKYKDKINVIQVESSVIKTFNKEHRVYVFPTIVVLKNGVKIAEFTDTRNEKNLGNFITKYLSESPRRPKKSRAKI